ncbi:transporter substrate-binding domain-containing protein [Spiractinospora alimapuensis]|uniref:transporter substrate-binding domain-containing protein n=1 Tax=Spiractinospora alimapuensis TaxID=2820884 RepID=UPI001F29A9F7|nr:transporter substrate-binding domain-containing protein [Spiractinospora alimapuensis]QVQ52150.1 transporter substrate-binding domain-containing protein [Spiractinospora alimapuensis]
MSKSVGSGHIAGLVLGAGAVALLVGVSLVNVQNHDDAQVRAEQSASPSPNTPSESPTPFASPEGDDEEVDSALERIEDGGTVRIGMPQREPYSLDLESAPRGFFPELADEVFTELGAGEIELVERSLAHSPDHINTDDLDILVIPNELHTACEDTQPGNPVTENLGSFLVEARTPQGIVDFSDFDDGDLITGISRSPGDAAHVEVDREQAVRAPIDEAPEMLAEGEIDGYAEESVRLRWWLSDQAEDEQLDNADSMETTDPFPRSPRSYSGFTFPTDEGDLRRAVNEVVDDMRADGRLAEIGEPWGFTHAELSPEAQTADEVCDLE